MKPIVLGYGLLGKEIVTQTNWDYISRQKDNFDFVNVSSYVTKIYKYDTVINCIADTSTYSPDSNNHWNINFYGVIQLVDYCNKTGIKLVHISTDYIYGGSVSGCSEEDVPVHCRNWYTYTKLLGDGYVKAMSKNYLLIRTSFKPKPFPYKRALTIQKGNFDYVDVIAKLIIKLINKNAKGVFNVGTDIKTVYELAKRTKPDVEPLDVPLDTTMPMDITMNIDKMKEFLNED